MRGAYRNSVAALLALGLAVAVQPAPVVAGPDEGAMRGPAAAIAKARAAAEKAEQRATKSDDQAAATVDDAAAPRPKAPAIPDGSATAGSVANEDTPQDQAQGEPPADAAAMPHRAYDVAAHRDPFRPPRLSGTVDARTPLETYQLGQLKLVGVVAQPSEGYRAMVEDSAGLGYIITTGTPIGSSGGVVRSIEPRRVVIEESTRDFYGEVKPKEVVMELPQEDRSP
jgi:Tfp pilus assembly protein PilP